MSGIVWEHGPFEEQLDAYLNPPAYQYSYGGGGMVTSSTVVPNFTTGSFATTQTSGVTYYGSSTNYQGMVSSTGYSPEPQDNMIYINNLYGGIRKYPRGHSMEYYCQFTVNTSVTTFATLVASNLEDKYHYVLQLWNPKEGYFKERVEFDFRKELENFLLAYRRFE